MPLPLVRDVGQDDVEEGRRDEEGDAEEGGEDQDNDDTEEGGADDDDTEEGEVDDDDTEEGGADDDDTEEGGADDDDTEEGGADDDTQEGGDDDGLHSTHGIQGYPVPLPSREGCGPIDVGEGGNREGTQGMGGPGGASTK